MNKKIKKKIKARKKSAVWCDFVLFFIFSAISMRFGEEEMQTPGLCASLGNVSYPHSSASGTWTGTNSLYLGSAQE
jgi:hypothetical protein